MKSISKSSLIRTLFGLLLTASAPAAEPAFVHPLELLGKFYSESRVLAIGEATHLNSTGVVALITFLEENGKDPQLKYVLLEATHDYSANYERLSVQEDPSLTSTHSEFATGRGGYCEASERAYRIKHLMPLIRKINQSRPKENPLLVKTFDAISQQQERDRFESDVNLKFRPGSCARQAKKYVYLDSSDRERGTAMNFGPIWEELVNRDQKAVMLYHQAHLIREVQDCMTLRAGPNFYTTVREPASWLGHFLRERPEASAQIRTVALDEQDTQYARSGVFTFTRRLRQRTTTPFWGLESRTVETLLAETSTGLLMPDHFLRSFHEGQTVDWQPDVKFNQMFDGLVWTGPAFKTLRMGASSIYRPECGG